MIPPDATARLHDIVATSVAVERDLAALGRDGWMADRRAVDATCFRLQRIGESASRLPADLKGRHPEVPWDAVRGMRNRLSHAHLEIDAAVVWQVAAEDVPTLASVARRELARQPSLRAGPAGRDPERRPSAAPSPGLG